MAQKCVVQRELGTALVSLCDAHTFREGIDIKQNETKENSIEKVYKNV